MVSSGDGGSAGCDDFDIPVAAQDGLAVNGFASTPWNIAVGGTDFYYSSYGGGILGGDIFTINIQNVKSMIDGIVEAGTIVRVVIDT